MAFALAMAAFLTLAVDAEKSAAVNLCNHRHCGQFLVDF
jgi:hypothetical protein